MQMLSIYIYVDIYTYIYIYIYLPRASKVRDLPNFMSQAVNRPPKCGEDAAPAPRQVSF